MLKHTHKNEKEVKQMCKIKEGDKVRASKVTELSEEETQEIKSAYFYEPIYLEARVPVDKGKVSAVIKLKLREWYFVAHHKGTGAYKREEIERL